MTFTPGRGRVSLAISLSGCRSGKSLRRSPMPLSPNGVNWFGKETP
ncbi:hypothetical protein V1278_002571 [Bradyrhizobium sp. AZCC 1577]